MDDRRSAKSFVPRRALPATSGGASLLRLVRLSGQIPDFAFELGEDLIGRVMQEHIPGVLVDFEPADTHETLDRLQPRDEAFRLEFALCKFVRMPR